MKDGEASEGQVRRTGFFRSMAFKYLISCLLGALLVWLAFRGEDWGKTREAFDKVIEGNTIHYVFGYIALFAAAHLIRIIRWGVLVRGLGPVRWSTLISVGSVGYMCIMVFPLRLGEFVRPYLVRGHENVTASGALATVVVERVIDGLLFVALFFFFVSLLPPSSDPAVQVVKLSAYAAGGVFVSALLVMVAALKRREWTVSIVRNIGCRIHEGLTLKAVGLLESFLDGLAVLPNKKRLGLFFALTVIYWAALGLGMRMMALGVDMPEVSWTGGFVLLTVLTVGIMVPAGPGFTGTFELALKGGFAVILPAGDPASQLLYILLLHVSQLLVQVSFGAIVLMTGRISLSDIKGPSADIQHRD